MAIRDWPEAERPRERLVKLGAGSLTDAELLALFLRSGLPGCDAVTLARDLLAEYGGLRALLAAGYPRARQSKGLGVARYAQLQAALELARRHLGERLARGDVLSCPEDTQRYLQARLRDLVQEVFTCLFLDNRNRVIACEEMFRGTIDGASVHPREVVKRALYHNAAAVIFAHNR